MSQFGDMMQNFTFLKVGLNDSQIITVLLSALS